MDEKKTKNKKARQKAYYVIFTVLSLAILIAGGICLNSIIHSGSERVVSREESLIAAIRDTSNSALTDDEFEVGVEKIIPKDYTTDSDYYSAVSELRSKIREEMALECEITRRNYFGTCAICLKVSGEIDITKLCEILHGELRIPRVYLQVLDTSGVSAEYICVGGEVVAEYNFTDILGQLDESGQEHSSDAELAEVWQSLVEEYQVGESRLVVTGTDVIVDLGSQISSADIISLFDYLYVWLQSNNKDYTLVVCRGQELYAYAKVQEARELFELYYPSQELAGYFRLAFYNANNYFKNSLYDSSLLYYAP